ncbi:MAG: glycosyl hydrolase family protein [Ruminococcaceae bacterium]|nr:glycosyl hydrolase family protein [Oscillospiraceae bacterium]
MCNQMKRIITMILVTVLSITAIPVYASQSQNEEVEFLHAVGNLNATKFLWKYGMTGEIIPAKGEFVGTGSMFKDQNINYTVIVLGDINGDGKIQASDYALVKGVFAGASIGKEGLVAADVNEDGRVTTADHIAIKKCVGGTYELWSAESYVGKRYLGYRIWNFSMSSLSSVKSITDAAKNVGFNTINLHIPWYQVEKEDGVYDYSAFDSMVDYIVKEKNMNCAIILYMGRMDGNDKVLSPEDYARDMSGNLTGGTGARTSITFASDRAVEKCVAFYEDAVKHFDDLYGGSIPLYLPSFSHYNETEYSCNGDFDHSAYMEEGFRGFLREKYGTIEKLNLVLGSEYSSFADVKSPSSSDRSKIGVLWYQFRHMKLKNLIDKLADAQHNARPDTKMCLQFGSVHDETSILRTTYEFVDLCEKADAVWVDDGPNHNHAWSMNYLSANLDIEYGNEIDGPTQFNASQEAYETQGMVSYQHGAKYVVCANWGFDTNFAGWSQMWKNISGTWLTKSTPEVLRAKKGDPSYIASTYAMFNVGGAKFGTFYTPVSKVLVDSDLLRYTPGEGEYYNFPGGFSTDVWTCTGWRNKGNTRVMPMTLRSGRWWASSCWIAPGIVNPISNIDGEINFNAPSSGTAKVSWDFRVMNKSGNGMGMKVLFNGTQIYPSVDGQFATMTIAAPVSGEFEIDLQQGDKLTFRTSLCETTGSLVSTNITVKMD